MRVRENKGCDIDVYKRVYLLSIFFETDVYDCTRAHGYTHTHTQRRVCVRMCVCAYACVRREANLWKQDYKSCVDTRIYIQ